MKAEEVREKIFADQVTLYKGVYTARYSFFFTGGKTSEDAVKKVTSSFSEVTIIDHGEVWKPFKGCAPVQKQSHWWVKFVFCEICHSTKVNKKGEVIHYDEDCFK